MSNTTTPSGTAQRSRMAGLGLAVAAAVLGIIGLLCPWVSLSADFAGAEDSANGFDPDFFGVPILVALVLGALAAVGARLSRFAAILTILCGATVSLLAIAGNAKVGNTRNEIEALGVEGVGDIVSTGFGVWLTLVAGVVMIVGGVLAVRRGTASA